MKIFNINTDKFTLLKEIENLRYQLKQYSTLLGVCPFDKEELKGEKGDPGTTSWNGIVDKPITFPPHKHEHTYLDIIDFPVFKTINGEKITGEGNIILHGTGDLSNYYSKKEIDNNFSTKQHIHSWESISNKPTMFSGDYNDLTNKPSIPNLSGYATETWVSSNYQTKGDYALKSEIPQPQNLDNYLTKTEASSAYQQKGNYLVLTDLNSYQKTTDADNKYQPKGNYLTSVSWNDVNGKPTLFSGSYTDLTNKPTSFPPSAHTHQISEVTGLQGALDGKENSITKNTAFNKNFGTTAGTVAEGNHTHNTIQTADGATRTFKEITKTAHDALVTKDPSVIYLIIN